MQKDGTMIFQNFQSLDDMLGKPAVLYAAGVVVTVIAKIMENFSSFLAVLTGIGGVVLVVLSIYNRHVEIKQNKEKLRLLEEERKKMVMLQIQKNEQSILAGQKKRGKPTAAK